MHACGAGDRRPAGAQGAALRVAVMGWCRQQSWEAWEADSEWPGQRQGTDLHQRVSLRLSRGLAISETLIEEAMRGSAESAWRPPASRASGQVTGSVRLLSGQGLLATSVVADRSVAAMVLERTAIIRVGAALRGRGEGMVPGRRARGSSLPPGPTWCPSMPMTRRVARWQPRTPHPRRCSSIVGPARSVLCYCWTRAVRPAWGQPGCPGRISRCFAMNGQPQVAPDPGLRPP